jgi:hypothetical protein
MVRSCYGDARCGADGLDDRVNGQRTDGYLWNKQKRLPCSWEEVLERKSVEGITAGEARQSEGT